MSAGSAEPIRLAGVRAGGSVAAGEIDWISLQAAVIRETGWTVSEFRQQPMGDVFDLWEHLQHEPPAHKILAWLHLKPRPSRSRAAKAADLKEEDVGKLAQTLGVAPQRMPAEVRAQYDWAQAEMAKRRKPQESKSPRT